MVQDGSCQSTIIVRAVEPPPHEPIQINSGAPQAFETDAFKGRLALWVAGLPDTPSLFAGRKRKTYLVIQGRFKRPLAFNDVWTGQHFQKGLQNLPPVWLLQWIFMFARRMAPSLRIGNPAAPFILSPLVSTAQVIHVAKAGEEPAFTDVPKEDMALQTLPSSAVAGNQRTSSRARKQFFQNEPRRAGWTFDTEHVYTFYFWQHLLDLASFKLNTGIRTFELQRHLNGQPLRLMAQMPTGETLWDFHVWHATSRNSTRS